MMLHTIALVVSLGSTVAVAQEPKVETVTPTAPIAAVTLYQGRAMVSRVA
ncbi:MAG: hypothetical protein RLZ94_2412, partial [Actinomycetota bacterium]